MGKVKEFQDLEDNVLLDLRLLFWSRHDLSTSEALAGESSNV